MWPCLLHHKPPKQTPKAGNVELGPLCLLLRSQGAHKIYVCNRLFIFYSKCTGFTVHLKRYIAKHVYKSLFSAG